MTEPIKPIDIQLVAGPPAVTKHLRLLWILGPDDADGNSILCDGTGYNARHAIAHAELNIIPPVPKEPAGVCWFRASTIDGVEVSGLFAPCQDYRCRYQVRRGRHYRREDLTNIRYGKPLSEEPDV